jgi:hypothetical protein
MIIKNKKFLLTGVAALIIIILVAGTIVLANGGLGNRNDNAGKESENTGKQATDIELESPAASTVSENSVIELLPEDTDSKIEDSAKIDGWKSLIRRDFVYETEDWNGFQRSDNKTKAVFQIDFPSDWTLLTTVFTDDKGDKLAEICPMTRMSPGQKLLENWSGDRDAKVLSNEIYKTDKYEGRKVISDLNVEGPGGGEHKFYKYYLKNGDMVFCITFYADINAKVDEGLYEKIVNSFRFLDTP